MNKVPTGLRKALAVKPTTEKIWKDLTPIARRDFITWIESAKQPETYERRIQKTCSMLATGKRRPCCYSMVPINLYKALGVSLKAKAQWKDLTSTERRDLVDWIGYADNPKSQKNRINTVCDLLSKGKRKIE